MGIEQKEKNGVGISIAGPEDVAGIFKVQYDTWLVTYPNEAHGVTIDDIKAKDFTSPERFERWKKSFIDEKDTKNTWVAKDENGKVVAFCSAFKQSEQNKLSALYVSPEYQGQGIGSKLIFQALSWLGREKDVTIDVVSYNERAQEIYKKFGFEFLENTSPADSAKLPSGKILPEIRMIFRKE